MAVVDDGEEMTADQLRQALDGYGNDSLAMMLRQGQAPTYRKQQQAILVAARCWLRLQEADQQLVEKIDSRLTDWEFHDVRLRINKETGWLLMIRFEFVRAVLAAITEKEKK